MLQSDDYVEMQRIREREAELERLIRQGAFVDSGNKEPQRHDRSARKPLVRRLLGFARKPL